MGKRRSYTATTLGTLLYQWGITDRVFTTADVQQGKAFSSISNETYGDTSKIYITVGSMTARRDLERKLTAEGFRVNEDYWPGRPVVDVQVRYFRGLRWNH